MRGSPLLRTLAVLLVLLGGGLGLARLLDTKPPSAPQPAIPTAPDESNDLVSSPFVLTLSHPASKLSLECGDTILTLPTDSQTVSGVLDLPTGHPAVFIDVAWQESDDSPRFAKLVLEPAGYSTLTRIFDSTKDLSDVWEIHLHE